MQRKQKLRVLPCSSEEVTLTGTVTTTAFYTPCVSTHRVGRGPRKCRNLFNSRGKLKRQSSKQQQHSSPESRLRVLPHTTKLLSILAVRNMESHSSPMGLLASQDLPSQPSVDQSLLKVELDLERQGRGRGKPRERERDRKKLKRKTRRMGGIGE